MKGKPIKDLTGQRFGYLTVLKFLRRDEQSRAIWLCRCDDNCGKEIEIRGDVLTSKRQLKTHCGCQTSKNNSNYQKSVRKDLTGFTSGYLTVLKFVGIKNGQAIWSALCDADQCGKKIEIRGCELTSKTRPMTHCGCQTLKNTSDAVKKRLTTHGLSKTKEYKAEHKHIRRIKLINSHGFTPAYKGSVKTSRAKLNYCVYCGSYHNLSTDHIIPIAKGGTQNLKNLVTACKFCNSSKNDSFFIDWYLSTWRVQRSLDDILDDMGFDSLTHFKNYHSVMCPESVDSDVHAERRKWRKAELKNKRLLDRYYRSLDHYPTH